MMFLKSLRKAKIWALSWTRLNASWPTEVLTSTLCSFQRVEMEEAILLGAPLFVGPALDSAWSQRCDDLRAVDRLSNVSSQEALILLRVSFNAPRVLHVTMHDHPALEMSTASWGPQSVTLPIPDFPIVSGFRLLCLSRMEVSGLDGLHRLHFQLF